MTGTNEAFSRVKIDAQLKDQGWDVLDINAVRFEYGCSSPQLLAKPHQVEVAIVLLRWVGTDS